MIQSSFHKIRNNPYLFFIFKSIALFVILFCLDFIIGNTLSYFYFKQESGLQYRTTYSIDSTKADLLVFGSSRANHHYYPDIFEKRLNLSYSNVGRDGNPIFFHYAVFNAVLKRYSPQVIFLDFVAGEFKQSQDSYDRLSSLLPYYKTHPEMRSIIELKSQNEKLKLCSSIYPYNSEFLAIAAGNAEFNKKRRGDIKGYVPLTKTWNGLMPIDSTSFKYELDSMKIKIFEAFIQDCIDSNVKLYIVCSPYYIKFNRPDYSLILAQEIANRHQIPFFDYSNNPVFMNNTKLFADPGHMNDEGAKVFSNMLIDKININE